ncbi:hypothetical protein H6G36_25430 [Anabaena minutissima FACHB-250]|nr:hypothetical protein [Anabaena minutissima FACHB-250]
MQQLTLLSELGFESDRDWTNDDWQTPNKEAQLIAKLAKPTDEYILEPCAGAGQIAKHLPNTVYANEVNWTRYRQGRAIAPNATWSNEDFLTSDVWECDCFDLICTNPPFSKSVEFIERSLQLLNPNNPESRLLFLLPLDWNCTLGMAEEWSSLGAHIHHTYQVKGRVAYLDVNGVPQKRRRRCDAVFDIRLGKKKGGTSYLE